MNNNDELIPIGNKGGDMKKTRQQTEVAKTLSGRAMRERLRRETTLPNQ